MVFTQEILNALKKQALKKQNEQNEEAKKVAELTGEEAKEAPLTKEASLQLYINQVAKLYRDVFGININTQGSLGMPGKMGGLKKVEAYFTEQKTAHTTRANYYSSWFEVLKALDSNSTMINQVLALRNHYRYKYTEIEDGLKSKKQEDNFMSPKPIDDKIEEYEKEFKEALNAEIAPADWVGPNILQIWMILKILREFQFRNETATLEFVSKKTYDNESKAPWKEGDPKKRNMVVMDNKKGWFISKNAYKTDKKYFESIIKLEGQILKDIKFYHSTMNDVKGESMLFKSSFHNSKRGNTMTSNALSKYLLNWSNKNLPPVVNEDGTKKPRNLGTTMIAKIYESAEHGESKAKIIKDSKNRGNKPATMHKVYVSTKKPEI